MLGPVVIASAMFILGVLFSDVQSRLRREPLPGWIRASGCVERLARCPAAHDGSPSLMLGPVVIASAMFILGVLFSDVQSRLRREPLPGWIRASGCARGPQPQSLVPLVARTLSLLRWEPFREKGRSTRWNTAENFCQGKSPLSRLRREPF